jgi:hypothetical protein
LRERGFALSAEESNIRVSPGSRLTVADRQAIRAHKEGLLAILRPAPEPEIALDQSQAPADPPTTQPAGSRAAVRMRVPRGTEAQAPGTPAATTPPLSPEAAPSLTPLSPAAGAEVERLLAELRTTLSAICRERFGRDTWPAHLAARMADALLIAEGYISGAAEEIARGWDPVDLLRRQVAFALELARTAPAYPALCGAGDCCGTFPVPPGAKLHFQDDQGRSCDLLSAHLWCWEGGPRWYSAARHPPPGAMPAQRRTPPMQDGHRPTPAPADLGFLP